MTTDDQVQAERDGDWDYNDEHDDLGPRATVGLFRLVPPEETQK